MAEYKWEKMDSVIEVILPPVSIGACKNVTNCKAYNVDLADGWCVKCWDRGNNTNSSIIEAVERREEERILKINRIETRGRHKRDCACERHTKKGFE